MTTPPPTPAAPHPDMAAAKAWAELIIAYKDHADNWPAFHDINNLARAYLVQQQELAELRRVLEQARGTLAWFVSVPRMDAAGLAAARIETIDAALARRETP